MGRPPTPPGEWGNVKTTELPTGVHEAAARYATFGGLTIKVRARGATAEDAVSELEARLEKKRRADGAESVLTPDSTVSELASFWLEEKSIEGYVGASSLNVYRGVVDNQIVPIFGARRIGDCRASTIDKVIKDRAATGQSTKQLRNALNQMFSLAVRHDAILSNPTRDAARTVRPKKEIVRLSLEQVAELRLLIAEEMQRKRPGPKMSMLISDVVDVMLGTGCRIGEVLALRWADVDLDSEAPTVTIAGTIETLKGEGTFRKPRPKSEAGFRVLLLPDFVVDLLRRRREEEAANPIDAVFGTRNGTWHQVSNVNTQWNRVVDGSAYDWVTFHVFRKSVASHIDEMENEDAAAAQLGHASSKTTRDHYIVKAKRAPDLTEYLDAFRPAAANIGGAA